MNLKSNPVAATSRSLIYVLNRGVKSFVTFQVNYAIPQYKNNFDRLSKLGNSGTSSSRDVASNFVG